MPKAYNARVEIYWYWPLLAASFLLGAIPFGYVIGRLFYQADIRTLGSKNIGMTNVWRSFGAGAGVATLLLDATKGALPVLAGRWLLHAPFGADTSRLALMLGGLALAAILGHTFTPFLGFKGGKGVATALGAVTALIGVWVLIPAAVFAIMLAVFRYVSLGSLSAAAALLTLTLALPSQRVYAWLGVLAMLLVAFTHRENIGRLIRGKESKIGVKSP
jgi:glycerol-3-phosphate acyltransferase PlsY